MSKLYKWKSGPGFPVYHYFHHRNIHAVAIKMYNFANRLLPEILNEVFRLRENPHYNLRQT